MRVSGSTGLGVKRYLDASTRSLSSSFEKLSSGTRINKPSDDAAGLSLASGLSLDNRVFAQAIRNINDGTSYLNVADGALAELKNILIRQREIATQSANGTFSDNQRQSLDQEFRALASEYNRIVVASRFNDKQVFNVEEQVSVQAGYGSRNTLNIDYGAVSAAFDLALTRVSVARDGTEGDGESTTPSISSNGRYVAFDSFAGNLVEGDTAWNSDIFVTDRMTGEVVRVSVATDGTEANNDSFNGEISGDGRYVAFQSIATNLTTGDGNGFEDIFVHDTLTGETRMVSVTSAGVQANADSNNPSISPDGRYVAFRSQATNLVAGDTNGAEDLFVHDLETGETRRISVSSSGVQGDAISGNAVFTADGRYVAFESQATNLVAGDNNLSNDIFMHDLQTGETIRVSLTSGGGESDGASYSPTVSADGRYIAFYSAATNLVSGDTNNFDDVFVYDRETAQTTRVSVSTAGAQGTNDSSWGVISADGRYVSYRSLASNLDSGDTNGVRDVFVHDLVTGENVRVNLTESGAQGNAASDDPIMSWDGRHIVFESDATNFASDGNGAMDVFYVGNPLHSAAGMAISSQAGLSVASQSAARAAQGSVDELLDELHATGGALGAQLSRFSAVTEVLAVQAENVRAAAGRIMDVDVAEEAANLVRAQIVQQTATAIYAQASKDMSSLLQLLQP